MMKRTMMTAVGALALAAMPALGQVSTTETTTGLETDTAVEAPDVDVTQPEYESQLETELDAQNDTETDVTVETPEDGMGGPEIESESDAAIDLENDETDVEIETEMDSDTNVEVAPEPEDGMGGAYYSSEGDAAANADLTVDPETDIEADIETDVDTMFSTEAE